jgi:integrase
MTVNHLPLSIQLGRRILATDSKTISKYIKNISTMNKSTAYMYFTRLSSFKNFISSTLNLQIDDLIRRIKEGNENAFEFLNEYISHLSNTNISSITIKRHVVTAKNFEYYDIDIGFRKFKLKVKLPRTIRKNKEALSKEDVTNILNACSDIRLKTYVMLLASTGMRAQEALSLRIKDFHLDEKSMPARLSIRGEFYQNRGRQNRIFN